LVSRTQVTANLKERKGYDMQSTREKIERIDLDVLPEEARKELKNFYNYLLVKYGREGKELRKRLFFESVRRHSFVLPEEYKFDREELHER
jgi:ribosomal protein S21